MEIQLTDRQLQGLKRLARNKILLEYLELLADKLDRNAEIDSNNVIVSYNANKQAVRLIEEHLVKFFKGLGQNNKQEDFGEYE